MRSSSTKGVENLHMYIGVHPQRALLGKMPADEHMYYPAATLGPGLPRGTTDSSRDRVRMGKKGSERRRISSEYIVHCYKVRG